MRDELHRTGYCGSRPGVGVGVLAMVLRTGLDLEPGFGRDRDGSRVAGPVMHGVGMAFAWSVADCCGGGAMMVAAMAAQGLEGIGLWYGGL